MNPKYPVYVPTKGRWKSSLTIKALEKIKVPYFAVVEKEELEAYKSVVGKYGKILVLPVSNLGLVPARNWIKKHSISKGAKRHWQIDDNMRDFYRLHNNIKYRVDSGTVFRVMEKFVDRYKNIAIAGPQYELLVPRKTKVPPFLLNTRVYSCSLVNNRAPYWWRDVYNDDTDICLRALKDGWCTVLFQAFLCDKMATMLVKGGNTDIYQKDGRLKMAQSLVNQHPDVTTVIRRFNRWQHHVDYRPFKKNKLKLKDDIIVPEGINNFGMVLTKVKQK
jgi:hypothetical protein